MTTDAWGDATLGGEQRVESSLQPRYVRMVVA